MSQSSPHTTTPLRLMTMNIEGHHHLDAVAQLIHQQQPDVICLQETFGSDIHRLAAQLNYSAYFEPMVSVTQPNRYRLDTLGEWGISLLVAPTLTVVEYQAHRYVQHHDDGSVPDFQDGAPNSADRVVQLAHLTPTHDNQPPLHVANTHFTWTPDGDITNEQQHDFDALMSWLEANAPQQHLFCGDFNAPRGRGQQIFAQLAQRYQDNIPLEFTTTIDGSLHYAGDLQLVVDGIFSTPGYKVENVRQHWGISDHTPISADVII